MFAPLLGVALVPTPCAPAPLRVTMANDEEDLCAWLSSKACLSDKVVNKARPKLDAEEVDSIDALQALYKLGGLSDVFSRVPAQQVADALDALAALSLSADGPTAPQPPGPVAWPMATSLSEFSTMQIDFVAKPAPPREPHDDAIIHPATRVQAAWRGCAVRIGWRDKLDLCDETPPYPVGVLLSFEREAAADIRR